LERKKVHDSIKPMKQFPGSSGTEAGVFLNAGSADRPAK
jgi:hypothetical protein